MPLLAPVTSITAIVTGLALRDSKQLHVTALINGRQFHVRDYPPAIFLYQPLCVIPFNIPVILTPAVGQIVKTIYVRIALRAFGRAADEKIRKRVLSGLEFGQKAAPAFDDRCRGQGFFLAPKKFGVIKCNRAAELCFCQCPIVSIDGPYQPFTGVLNLEPIVNC